MKNISDFLNDEKNDIKKTYTNPVDYFNRYVDVIELLEEKAYADTKRTAKAIIVKDGIIIDQRSAKPNMINARYNEKVPVMLDETKGTWQKVGSNYKLLCSMPIDLELKVGREYTPFEMLTIYIFKSIYESALKYVEYNIIKKDIPYIRVGCDYYKKIEKPNVFGVKTLQLKAWQKQILKDDHGANILKKVPMFDDFIIVPDNKDYKNVVNGMYNLYAPFPHKPHNKPATVGKFAHIDRLLNHIFGEQIELGYKYLKILYEHPKQILPVLVLVSKERQTGKTTFLNLLSIIFGDNHVQVKPEDLTSDFNSSYANKNIIVVDETSLEKSQAVERIKAISTQKIITVNQKHVAHYSIPFYGKIVLATNKEKEFIRIDEEEIRFWVRKVNTIPKKITNIERMMRDEVPFLLRYLEDLPEIDFTRDRMVFTADEIRTDQLNAVVEESRSWMYKELKINIQNMFYELYAHDPNCKEFKATPTDIKNKFFDRNQNVQVNYIAKVLQDELKMEKPTKAVRYSAFNNVFDNENKPGKAYTFKRDDFFPDGFELEDENVEEFTEKGSLPF